MGKPQPVSEAPEWTVNEDGMVCRVDEWNVLHELDECEVVKGYEALRTVAAEAAANEREACADRLERLLLKYKGSFVEVVAAIRARGKGEQDD